MDIIILIHIGIAVWLYRYFANEDRGSKEPASALRAAIVFGVIAVLVAGFINDTFLPREILDAVSDSTLQIDNAVIVRSSLQIALTEELLKFLPLAIFIYKKPYFNELTDGVIYFGLAGMWFGAIESISYASMFGAGVGISRAITMPFLHAGMTALAGIGLARYKIITKNPLTVVGWFSLAVLLHAVYDYLLFARLSYSALLALVMAIGINVGLFVFFKKARSWDEKRGLSAVGINRFCRNCGAPNPEKHLYCTRCGKYT